MASKLCVFTGLGDLRNRNPRIRFIGQEARRHTLVGEDRTPPRGDGAHDIGPVHDRSEEKGTGSPEPLG